MTIKEVIKHFKGRANTARAVGVSYQAVRQWEEKGEVPEGRQWQIQALTGGALTAEQKLTA